MAEGRERAPRIAEKAWNVELERSTLDRLHLDALPHVRPREHPPTGNVFAIDTPPPYPSGKWHIGAVAHYSLIDVIARSRRMAGDQVLFPWGVDRNGINIEQVVEKKTGKPLAQWDREEFIRACHAEIGKNTEDLEVIAKRVAMSCDFANKYETDAPEYRAMSQAGFIKLWHQGDVVEDLRPNNYDPVLGTAIADADVFYESRETDLVHVRWTIRETGQTVLIATTRPELICACQVVLVHPEDDRTKGLVGTHAKLPLFGREVPVRAHTHVDREFGSGVMMVCSYGDQADVALFRELALEPISAIDTRGRMTEAAGPYAGLKVKEAREKIKQDLAAAGLVEKTERIAQKFPISERSKAPVELVLLKEWYVRQTHVVDDLRRIAHEMHFHPDKHRQILLDWLDTVTIDWPVSRRRYYHTEIPLWFLDDDRGKETQFIAVPPPGPYYQPWREAPPPESDVFDRETRKKLGKLKDLASQHPNLKPRGETKVFDTWMDSSQSNLYVLGWHDAKQQAFFRANFPCSLRPQGRDIVRTWLYYTTLKSYLLEKQKPFQHVWISGLGMDEHGRKMSKSLGNVIEPDKVLEKHGADAFRFWIASECTIGDDFRISEERIAGARKFITKLYNVARFISMFEAPAADPKRLAPVDAWVRAEFNKMRDDCVAGYEDFNFFRPGNAIRDFVWNLFAPHYLEMVKARAYADDPGTVATLHGVLRGTLQLLAPIAPIVTYSIAKELYGTNVHTERFPTPLALADDELAKLTPRVEEFNSTVWGAKKDKGLSLRDPLPGVSVPPELAPFREELTGMHGLGA